MCKPDIRRIKISVSASRNVVAIKMYMIFFSTQVRACTYVLWNHYTEKVVMQIADKFSCVEARVFRDNRGYTIWLMMPWLLASAEVMIMMTSSNGNIFRVTGPLWGESTGHRWIIFTKASDMELWCFLWSAPEQTVPQTIDTGDLGRHCAHYDITVMFFYFIRKLPLSSKNDRTCKYSFVYFSNDFCTLRTNKYLLTWNIAAAIGWFSAVIP